MEDLSKHLNKLFTSHEECIEKMENIFKNALVTVKAFVIDENIGTASQQIGRRSKRLISAKKNQLAEINIQDLTVRSRYNGSNVYIPLTDSTFTITNNNIVTDNIVRALGDATFTVTSKNIDITYDAAGTNSNNNNVISEDKINNAKDEVHKTLMKYKPVPKSKLKKPCVQTALKKEIEDIESLANRSDNPTKRQPKAIANEFKENTNPIKLNLLPSTSTRNKTPSQSRYNSVDWAITKVPTLIDEKKKALEEKRQKAVIVREIKERERQERLVKLMEEREEKSRKKIAEKEKNQIKTAREKNFHMVEDTSINRNLKILEARSEERDQQQKLDKRQKQYKQDQAESAKRERQMIENLKVQKTNDQLQQIHNNLFKHNLLLKQNVKDNGYNFDMIETDDSTDEESLVKSNRPPVPEWSKEKNRLKLIERQTYLNTDLTDSFFSVQPMTPNLLEIFPGIDHRDLQRNSSAEWTRLC